MLVEEVAVSPPGPHDVVVQLRAAGVCHTDAFVASGGVPCPPAILGHEGCGIVDWVGPEVTDFRVGDRVVGLTIPRCGTCANCRRGDSFLCDAAALYGPPRASRVDGTLLVATNGLGTFAEAMTVHRASVIGVECDLPDDQLALIGCAFMTGCGAVFNTAEVRAGSTVIVVGCGGVGQAVIQASRVANAARIVAVDPIAAKRALALRSGATDAYDPDGASLSEIADAAGLDGADYVFDTIGSPQTLHNSYLALRRGGTVVVIGVGAIRTEIRIPGTLVVDAKRVIGCVFGSADVDRNFPYIIDLAERGHLDISSVVTETVALDGVDAAMRALDSGKTLRTVIGFG
ncbi:zinc-binding dehydrogenase [[Mycobacterium] burgundiense]|uniref:Zinc-binding dehydrogenase n=1 Tax=[Mycobacterium] burgundiense TaxID=3064286 RepID=A0ABN9N4J8_9MYCO|nr:zinc-binding dehydrogenase [Mycolicibacterium sp. MU0053]CAJ1500402.1 zinc-binding dehydrogenase [Mycolicibacterium sp. MU0053]